jgi:hypothetical protein
MRTTIALFTLTAGLWAAAMAGNAQTTETAAAGQP